MELNHIFRSLLGIVVLTSILYLFSNNRKNINWKLVITGLSLQIIFGLLVLKIPFVHQMFDAVARGFAKLTSCTDAGTDFLLRSFVSGNVEIPVINFAFRILPTVIFFSALSSLLYYFGILQKVVYLFAWIMKKTMRLSGPESLSAAGNIFMGQTEAPLLVKPYIKNMTNSELLCLMTGGMATIAGGVLAAYIGFLGGGDEQMKIIFATHLLSASIMSAPAAIVASKIMFPETEYDRLEKELDISDEQLASNALESISIGTSDGIKLAVNVGAMLLVFIAFIYMFNLFLSMLGSIEVGNYLSLNKTIELATDGKYTKVCLEYIFGILFAPLAWIIGVAKEDIVLVGRLLGEKTIINEFVAYVSLGTMKTQQLFKEERSIIIATYALCGFSNIASIGIQIGGIGAMAPERRSDLSKLGIKALIAGSVACFYTACVVGFFV
jgi:CNT family concentrative nucleoside transporter